jgi:beta-1,4-mannosyl-glycoprotein beta-1,4-N-acetylglucosaminyltransferase
MFYDELDWLECQLWETYDQMHKYILVEATLDHQGHPKPLFYDGNKSRFEQWQDKIIHVIVRDLPTPEQAGDHWLRERPQRDAAMRILIEQAEPIDLILNLDIDEVPSQRTMTAEPMGITGLQLANHLFAVDWYAEENVMGTMLPMYCLNPSMRSSDIPGAVQGGLSWIRESRYHFPYLERAGHHFSWVGGPEEYTAKDKRSPHTEHSEERMRAGQPESSYAQGAGQTPCEVDDTYPRYIRERRCPESWFRPR